MKSEILITKNGNDDQAILLINGFNVACIRGNLITIACHWRTHADTDIFVYINGEIMGQFNNINENYTITDNR